MIRTHAFPPFDALEPRRLACRLGNSRVARLASSRPSDPSQPADNPARRRLLIDLCFSQGRAGGRKTLPRHWQGKINRTPARRVRAICNFYTSCMFIHIRTHAFPPYDALEPRRLARGWGTAGGLCWPAANLATHPSARTTHTQAATTGGSPRPQGLSCPRQSAIPAGPTAGWARPRGPPPRT